MLRLGSTGTMDLRFDVLNVLNDAAEESLRSDVLFPTSGVRNNTTFGQPNVAWKRGAPCSACG